MRTASILLALVVVLNFVRDAGAFAPNFVAEQDHTIVVGGQTLGFRTGTWVGDIDFNTFVHPRTATYAYLGPLGSHNVPFTATQGLVGFCVIVAGVIALAMVFTVLWRRRAT
jgi:hypothetical protein